ncbi:MAG: hypothetical protein ACTHJJ_03670 [Intrasporangium sp.]|uniref:hypothetical protein n=1 Tax=Intrasporangium sp. TaxID=1925024 RepID=UPI003F7F4706
MDARPEIPDPDPDHDRYVAFPDEAATPPPESWWGPAPPPLPAPPSAPVQCAPPSGRRRARWAVIGVILLLSMMSTHHSGSGGAGGIGHGSAYGESSPGIDLEPSLTAPTGRLQPADTPLDEIPEGTMSFRLEVVGQDPRATVGVTTDDGYGLDTGEVALPYGASLTRNNPHNSLAVTVQSADGQAELQCRVYLDEALVSIGTGDGTATCEVPRTR